MKITINSDSSFADTEITINCKSLSDDIEKIIAMIRMVYMKLTAYKDGQQYVLDAADIIYIDSIDRRTFLYTASGVYESSLKLYELEEKLIDCDFLRANKNCLFNTNYIQSVKPDLDRRIILTMEKNIMLIVSRQYSAAVKQKLEAYHG
jgi:DNA-binding LytR/AlgR family response regulator